MSEVTFHGKESEVKTTEETQDKRETEGEERKG